MFTSNEGQSYYEFNGELYPLLDYSDTSTDGTQIVYLKVPFITRLYMSIKTAIRFLRLSMSHFYSYDISEDWEDND